MQQIDLHSNPQLRRQAKALYLEACRELTQLALGVRKQLDFEGTVSVSLTGGLTHAAEFVAEPLRRMLSEHDMEYIPFEGSPLQGAVLLACKHANI